MRFLIFLLCILATIELNAQDEKAPELSSYKEKASYTVGFDVGLNLRKQESDLDMEVVVRGILDAYKGKQHPLDQEEIRAVMTVYLKELEKKQIAKWQELGRSNLKAGEDFLKQNRSAEGVVQLESGLQYKIERKGTGETPTVKSQVKVHFRSKNLKGQELDNTYKAQKPIAFTVGGALRGWSEALQRMKVGGKWTIYIPSSLAYGPNGFQPLVGPNETLILEFELLEIVK